MSQKNEKKSIVQERFGQDMETFYTKNGFPYIHPKKIKENECLDCGKDPDAKPKYIEHEERRNLMPEKKLNDSQCDDDGEQNNIVDSFEIEKNDDKLVFLWGEAEQGKCLQCIYNNDCVGYIEYVDETGRYEFHVYGIPQSEDLDVIKKFAEDYFTKRIGMQAKWQR